jgi:hypothetical protein
MRVPAGFIDIPDAALSAHQVITDDDLVKISENANFAVVRCEIIFMGFYKHGDEIAAPASPIDGYQYSLSEICFDWTIYSTRGTDSNIFVSGQADAPGIGTGLSLQQDANLYYWVADINDSTGQVTLLVSTFAQGKKSEIVSNDGVLKVHAICQRASVNVAS